MGRIFEVRKHTMFARWDRMAKQFQRIGKEIAIAVRSGGPNQEANPALRRAIQNARAVNMPKDKVEAAIARASGRDGTQLRRDQLRGLRPARHRDPGRPPRPTTRRARWPTCATSSARATATWRNTGSVGFLFKHMGAFRLDPKGIDQESLELDLIDHGLEEMGESAGEKGEPQLLLRCAFANFGQLQKALEDRDITPLSAESEYLPITPVSLDEAQTTEVLKLIDRLEQEDDVQNVFHNLA